MASAGPPDIVNATNGAISSFGDAANIPSETTSMIQDMIQPLVQALAEIPELQKIFPYLMGLIQQFIQQYS